MRLRVVDGGAVSALRSQSQWHGLGSAMAPEASPILSFCSPAEPYVGLGYHRRLGELDLGACLRQGLAVIRRQVGGGPVYLDEDQLFFQIVLPAERAPARVDLLYRRLLQPAVTAFRHLGVDAELRDLNEIAAGERKLSGTAAGRIGNGVLVVGNVLFRFPHQRMVQALSLPSDSLREHCLRLMRRHVSSLATEGRGEVGREEAKTALVECYSDALGLEAEADVASARELAAMESWERRFGEPEWLAGPASSRGSEPAVRRIKITSRVWLIAASGERLRLEAAVAEGVVAHLFVAAVRERGARLNGTCGALRERLLGVAATEKAVGEALASFGDLGEELTALLAPGLRAP